MATIGQNPYAPDSEEYPLWEKQFGSGAAAVAKSTPGITASQINDEQANTSVELNPDVAAGNLAMRQQQAAKASAPVAPTSVRPVLTTAKPDPTRAYKTNPDGTITYLETDQEIAAKAAARPVLGAPNPLASFEKPKTQEEIRQEEIKRAQAVIDATEGLFQENLADIRTRGAAALGQTRSIGVSAGLASSPFAQAQQAKTEAATVREEQAARAERAAQIAAITAAAEGRATTEYDRQITRYQQERALIVSEGQNEREEARIKTEASRKAVSETIVNAARAGLSLKDMDPMKYQQMLDDSGMSEFEANSLYVASNPSLNGKTEVSNGYVVSYYVDPKTGKPVISKEALPKELATVDEADLVHVNLEDGVYVYDKKHLNADGTPKLKKLGEKAAEVNFDEAKFTADLRKEFNNNKTVQDFQTVDSAYRKLEAVGNDIGSGPARDAMVIVFNKMLDPGSVVREGEFARTADGQAVITKAAEWVKALTTPGAGIGPETLQQMKDAAKKIHAAGKTAYDQEAEFYRQNAVDAGVDPKNVIRTMSDVGTSSGIVDKDDPDFKDLRNDPDLKGVSDEDIWSMLGKTDVGSDTKNAQTGSKLSEKYESGGNPGAIGFDSTGGYSYGKYQLAHQNAKRFVEQSSYANDFKGLAFNSKEWKNKWQEVAKRDPEGFGNSQTKYIQSSHVAPQIAKLEASGVKVASLDPVIMDVIWSTAVQHGANTDVIQKAIAKVGKNANARDLINAIYDERWSGGKRFASSTPAVRAAVQRRLVNEKNDALALIG